MRLQSRGFLHFFAPCLVRCVRVWVAAALPALLYAQEPVSQAPIPGPVEGIRAPQGMRAAILARAPDILRPVAIALDSKGRPWVLERGDGVGGGRIRILLGAGSGGHTFAAGLRDATGLALGHGGAFIGAFAGAASSLLFLADSDGDDVPDGPPEPLVSGFEAASLAERLHSFAWGPDGWLYGCHGGRCTLQGVEQDCGIWRFHPRSKRFEVAGSLEVGARGLRFDAAGRPHAARWPPAPDGWEDLGLDPRFDWTAAAPSLDGRLFLLDGELGNDCGEAPASPPRGRIIVVSRSGSGSPPLPSPGQSRTAELWSRFKRGEIDSRALATAFDDSDSSVRAAAIRISGEVDPSSWPAVDRWELLASRETDPLARRELEALCRKRAMLDSGGLRWAAHISRAARLDCASGLALDAILLEGEEPAVSRLTSLWSEAPDDATRALILERLARLPGAPLERLVLDGWASLSPLLRGLGVSAMASREVWALSLLAAVEAGKVPESSILAADAHRMTAIGSARVRLALDRAWGRVARESSTDLDKRRRQLEAALQAGSGSLERGAQAFDKRCAKCHELRGKGHRVGPPLDDVDRSDLSRLVRSIVDPNDEVRRAYYSTGALLRDGRFVQGILVSRAAGQITLRREEGVEESYALSDVRKLVESGVSQMPEGLTNDLPEGELRDLIAYLVSTPALSRSALAGPFRAEDGGDSFQAAFPPESASGSALAVPVEWRDADAGAWGRFDGRSLGLCRPGEAAYLRASIESQGPMSVEWILETNASVRVWAGTICAFEGRASSLRQGQPVRFRMGLAAGRSEILVKIVRADWANLTFRMLLEDPQGRIHWPQRAR